MPAILGVVAQFRIDDERRLDAFELATELRVMDERTPLGADRSRTA